uniref:Uncharacterized protein n=1 Tax=Glossina austeni TaxID=7395 RepID=A0A1A9USE5_GLOAU
MKVKIRDFACRFQQVVKSTPNNNNRDKVVKEKNEVSAITTQDGNDRLFARTKIDGTEMAALLDTGARCFGRTTNKEGHGIETPVIGIATLSMDMQFLIVPDLGRPQVSNKQKVVCQKNKNANLSKASLKSPQRQICSSLCFVGFN